MSDKLTTNLANYNPKGGLGELLTKAKAHNHFDAQLQPLLVVQFKGIHLCLIEDNVATFIASNGSAAFRANKQRSKLLGIVKQIDKLSTIEKVVVKLNKNQA